MSKTQTGEEIGTKLLASIREMKAQKRGRVTEVRIPNAALARSKDVSIDSRTTGHATRLGGKAC